MFTKDLLKNKRILITGGGTGLGKEMASHFAEYGADIYICGRRDNVLQDTAKEIKETAEKYRKGEYIDIKAISKLRSQQDDSKRKKKTSKR